MPCWTVQTMSVEFKAQNVALLEKALKELKWVYQRVGDSVRIGDISIDLKAGKATLPTTAQSRLNELKRAYSFQAVKMVAAAKNWSVQGNAQKGQMVKW